MPIFTRVTIAKRGSQTAKKQRLRLLRQANRLKQLGAYDSKQSTQVGKPTGELEPPAPPLALTPALAADPETAIEVLCRRPRCETGAERAVRLPGRVGIGTRWACCWFRLRAYRFRGRRLTASLYGFSLTCL